MLNVTPLIPKDKKIIEKYGNGSFTITQERYESSVILFPDEVYPVAINTIEEVTPEHFKPILDNAEYIEVLLIGSGLEIQKLNHFIKEELSSKNISIEIMDTGSACRTYNVLLAEERLVAALLLSV